jgi:hypothetical protein
MERYEARCWPKEGLFLLNGVRLLNRTLDMGLFWLDIFLKLRSNLAQFAMIGRELEWNYIIYSHFRIPWSKTLIVLFVI